jgi:tRNA A64-2'-O-ribosylphosphate transferase
MRNLSNKLKKPLRPLWFTPSSNIFLHNLPDYTKMSFFPVICLSASQVVESGVERRNGFLYVQGSADDHEMWSKVIYNYIFT